MLRVTFVIAAHGSIHARMLTIEHGTMACVVTNGNARPLSDMYDGDKQGDRGSLIAATGPRTANARLG